MITATGYSKDPNIQPEGIMLTLPTQFFTDRGMTTDQFKKYFERLMKEEDTIWNFRLTNLPTIMDIAWVYLVFDKHVQYRMNFVQYERGVSKQFKDSTDQRVRDFPNANWVIFTGPPTKPPHYWPQKGFQGFRYTTKLF
jgi:hypothetical protein